MPETADALAAASGTAAAHGNVPNETPKLRHSLPRAVGLGLATIVLTYGSCEVARRTVLQGLDIRQLHLFHIVRGLASSILTAAVVGWALLRSAPPLLAPARAPPVARVRLQRYEQSAGWLVRMRWLVVVTSLAAIVIGIRVVPILSVRSWWPLLATTGALAGTNVLYGMLAKQEGRLPILQLQLCSDLAILTLLLHFSGGVDNPLSLLALFHVVIAGILLPRRDCYVIAAFAAGLYALLVWVELGRLVPHYPLLVMPTTMGSALSHDPGYGTARAGLHTGALFLIAYFVTTLAERARHNELRLYEMADQALAERRLLERALETTGVGLCVLNEGLQPEWWNRRWTAWSATAGTAFNDCAAEAARATRSDGRVRRAECSDTDDPESHSAFMITTALIHDANHKVRQVVELVEDVTEQRQVQARLAHASKMAAVGQLAGQVAHEVNNPIAIISAKALLLLSNRRREMSDKVASDLDKIVKLSDRVAGIAQSLLSYCRPSRGRRATADLRAPIRSAVALVEQRARSSGVRISDQLEQPLPAEINTSEMEQVFLNLALNALDAMPEGGQLRLAPRRATGSDPVHWVGAALEDTGPGISMDQRKRVFEPFFSSKGKGTGLGLSICQELVESHGGRIEVDSAPGGGARFTVWLPASSEVARV